MRIIDAAQGMLSLYRAARTEALALPDPVPWAPSTGGFPGSPVSDTVIPAGLSPSSAEAGAEWQWGTSTAERLLRWWNRILNDKPPNGTIADVMGQIAGCLTLVADLKGTWDEQAGLPQGTREQLMSVMTTAEGAVRAALLLPDGMPLFEVSLAIEVLFVSMAWADDAGVDVPCFRYCEITPAAPSLLPLDEVAAALPGDVNLEQFAERWPHRKLYGERWNHFGSFALKEGRVHDWLWGRLDGAAALADLFLTGVHPLKRRR